MPRKKIDRTREVSTRGGLSFFTLLFCACVLTRRAPFFAPGAVIECGGIRSGALKNARPDRTWQFIEVLSRNLFRSN
jgi:hypothetical protein